MSGKNQVSDGNFWASEKILLIVNLAIWCSVTCTNFSQSWMLYFLSAYGGLDLDLHSDLLQGYKINRNRWIYLSVFFALIIKYNFWCFVIQNFIIVQMKKKYKLDTYVDKSGTRYLLQFKKNSFKSLWSVKSVRYLRRYNIPSLIF